MLNVQLPQAKFGTVRDVGRGAVQWRLPLQLTEVNQLASELFVGQPCWVGTVVEHARDCGVVITPSSAMRLIGSPS